jgi:hypothetical protein
MMVLYRAIMPRKDTLSGLVVKVSSDDALRSAGRSWMSAVAKIGENQRSGMMLAAKGLLAEQLICSILASSDSFSL